MYTEVTFLTDNTARIIERDSEGLKSRKVVKANQAMCWMVKQGKVWEWFKNDEGNEVAVWEKELAE